MDIASERTFLAANTPKGFKSLYEPFLEEKTQYVIKGGPGTGKSSLMKKIAAEAAGRGFSVEYIYCSSDLHSLDGIYIKELNTAVCDGTPPHSLDVDYPGAAGGIINLSNCWDEKKLRKCLSEIRVFNSAIASEYSRVYGYLAAASAIYENAAAQVNAYIMYDKLDIFVSSLIEKTFQSYAEKKSTVCKRFLTALTPSGFMTFKDTIYTGADSICVFDDKYGICESVIDSLAKEAVKHGYDISVFYNPMRPDKPSHLIIPELRKGFATNGYFCSFDGTGAGKINTKRFISEDVFLIKNRLKLSEKLMKGCIDEAAYALGRAKSFHDDLEEIYIASMNFDKVGSVTASLMTRLFM